MCVVPGGIGMKMGGGVGASVKRGRLSRGVYKSGLLILGEVGLGRL